MVDLIKAQNDLLVQLRISSTLGTVVSLVHNPSGFGQAQVASLIPNAFQAQRQFTPNVASLQDHATGAWNMDTTASSHFNSSVNSLRNIFNKCMYPFVYVGDGKSIPVTNSVG